jgi:hypothetical protein
MDLTTAAPDPHADPRPAAAPDWAAVAEEVRCPLCGYNLRGLAEPRCPECGYRFEWEPLLDPTQRLHKYLFEHHPERNLRSFVRTMLGGLLPRRFWRSLQPAQPSRPGRLVLYWLLAALLGFTVVATEAGRSFYAVAKENELVRAAELRSVNRQMALQPYLAFSEVQAAGGPQAWVDKQHPPTFSQRFIDSWYQQYPLRLAVGPALLYFVWPWLTLLTLLIFRASMRQAKVRTVHVLRCVLYSCDAGLWLVPLLTFGAAAFSDAVSGSTYSALLARQRGFPLVPLALAAYTAYRLAAAYRFYLRFDRPAATALAAQVIVMMLVLVVWLNLPEA